MSSHYDSEEEPPRKQMRWIRSVIPIIDLTQDEHQDDSQDDTQDATDSPSDYYDVELFDNPLCVPFSCVDSSATELLVDGTQKVFDEMAKLHYCLKRYRSTEGVPETIERLRHEVSCLALLWHRVIHKAEQHIMEFEAMRRRRTL